MTLLHEIAPPRAGAAGRPPLRTGRVYVWWVPILGTEAAERDDILSEPERRRAGRFVFQRDQAQFVACRRALRQLLGGYMGCPPRAITFDYASRGKPAVARGGGGLEFNVSHTPGMGVIALAVDRPVGVDVECVRADPWAEAIAARYFSTRERAAMARVRPAAWRRTFFRIWTRREAALKVSGEGLRGLTGAMGETGEAGIVPIVRSLRLPWPDHVASVAAPGTWTVTYAGAAANPQ